MSEKDVRPCPECRTPMKQKRWSVPYGRDEFRWYCEGHTEWLSLWQCPSCKNCEIATPDYGE